MAYKQYGDKVQFIMLNPVKSERAGEDGKNFIKQAGYTFPVFYETEGKVYRSVRTSGIPSHRLYRCRRKYVNKNVGAIAESKLSDNINPAGTVTGLEWKHPVPYGYRVFFRWFRPFDERCDLSSQ